MACWCVGRGHAAGTGGEKPGATAALSPAGALILYPLLPCPSPLSICSDLLLSQLWAGLPAAERSDVLSRLAVAEGREKLPALKAQAAQLAGKLRQLAG